ncbi:MAG: cytochrome c oxidase subunit II transmembrane domain-containing protein [Flavobacteriales bacterium]
MKLLILLVGVLGIIAIAQLTKVYELTRSMRKTREEEITPSDNKLQANLMLVWMFLFFIGVIFLYGRYGDYLPESASEHGVAVDNLMAINIWMITIVFFAVNFLLFYFSWKFQYKKERKARFFAHDNRLEMLWTLIPGVTMAFIIVYGLITWNNMTGPASADAIQIEVYSKQFGWIVRYPGDNKTFGSYTYNLIDPSTNPLGMVTRENIENKIEEIDAEIEKIEAAIEANHALPLWPESYLESQEEKVYRLQRQKQRILDLNETVNPTSGLSEWEAGADDKIVNTEMHIPVGKEVEFIFRSQDVIHSAYMPHFRSQMNTVPGVPTRFKMTPTITTEEMREKTGNDEFNYILLCNKVCGVSHYNMKINVIVESESDYMAWLEKQKTYVAPEATEETSSSNTDTVTETEAPAETTVVASN